MTETEMPLVVLKSKMGELEALSKASEHDELGVVPLIELVGSGNEQGNVWKQLRRCAETLICRGTPLWVDVGHLPTAHPLRSAPGGALLDLDEKIDPGPGLWDAAPLIPVVSLPVDETTVAQIAMLQEHCSRDVVLRVSVPLGYSLALLGDEIYRLLRGARIEPERLKAILDTGYIPQVEEPVIEEIATLVRFLADSIEIRSIYVVGGSVPQTRELGVTSERVRPEWEIYSSVEDELDRSSVTLRYGDYGVVHPKNIELKGKPRNPNPYVHYTTVGGSMTVSRRAQKDTKGALAEAFTEVAEQLTRSPKFAGPRYSWGDEKFVACRRAGESRAGSASKWIAMATSHHISHLTKRADGTA